MTFSDALHAFPGILLALSLIAVLGQRRHSIVIALSIAYLPSVVRVVRAAALRSEEHTSELQSLMRTSYAVFCLKKKIHLDNTEQQLSRMQEDARDYVKLGKNAEDNN